MFGEYSCKSGDEKMNNSLAMLGGKPQRITPFHNWPVFGKEEEQSLIRVLRSGQWGSLDGGEVLKFEERFAEYQGAQYAIAVANGTVALRIALMAIGIQAGDEVIVPPYTFLATATSVVEANATPVFVDIDPITYNIDPSAIEATITEKTKAIIPVHFAGLSSGMDEIMDIAKKHNLVVIEDAAHAHGGEYKGRRLGSIGHLSCFSFQSSKNLTSGEGGIIITSDKNLVEACRSIRNCGRTKDGPWYEHYVISGNYRLTEFQGAILNCQLDRLEDQCNTRVKNGQYLAGQLTRIPGIDIQRYDPEQSRHSFHLFIIQFKEDVFGFTRDLFVKALNAEGVPISIGYPLPLYKQPLFVNNSFGPYSGCLSNSPQMNYSEIVCPVCEKVCFSEGTWLHHSVLLGTKQDMDDIVKAIEKVYNNRKDLSEMVR
jgi:dTDP-4-amino-4,6-dideoxygalactose transaminase